jgi:ribonuclease D
VFPRLRRLGLRNLSASVLHLNLSKGAQMSNWEGRMSAKMSTYASNDALVGLVLFRGLIGTLELVGMFDLGYDSFFL